MSSHSSYFHLVSFIFYVALCHYLHVIFEFGLADTKRSVSFTRAFNASTAAIHRSHCTFCDVRFINYGIFTMANSGYIYMGCSCCSICFTWLFPLALGVGAWVAPPHCAIQSLTEYKRHLHKNLMIMLMYKIYFDVICSKFLFFMCIHSIRVHTQRRFRLFISLLLFIFF